MSLANNPKARNRSLGIQPTKPPATWVEKEPSCGSVVLTESFSGTAWQRHYSDGLWHSTTGKVKEWSEVGLRAAAGLPHFRALIYTAPED